MLFPEKFKQVRFPAPFMIPTYTYQQKTSFSITTNAAGCCWLEVNLGQFLDTSKFKTGIAGSQNGTSVVPNSNVFFDSRAALDGGTPLADASQANGHTGLSYMQVPTGTFNAVRCGPMSVKYEYTGRLDNSSGVAVMGKK